MDIKIDVPNQTELVATAQRTLATAQSFRIESAVHYAQAAGELQTIKGRLKALEDQRKELTKPLDESKKKIMELFRGPSELLLGAESAYKISLIAYDYVQGRQRKAEEDRLREIVRKEQERIAAEARKAEAVAREKQAELERKAEAARKAGDEALAAKLAAKSEAIADKAADKVAALNMRAETMPTPIVTREVKKVAGLSMRTVYRARVVNAAIVPREWLIVNEAALLKFAEATQGVAPVPGVEFYAETIAASARR